jgi:hypothetical protein
MTETIREQQQHNRSSSNSNIITTRRHHPHPLRRHTQSMVLLVLIFVTLTHAFLVPLPASSSSCPNFRDGVSTTHPSSLASSSSRPTTTALPARYTSKDTGDRKKKARIRGFKSAKTGGPSKRPGMTEEEMDYFDRLVAAADAGGGVVGKCDVCMPCPLYCSFVTRISVLTI